MFIQQPSVEHSLYAPVATAMNRDPSLQGSESMGSCLPGLLELPTPSAWQFPTRAQAREIQVRKRLWGLAGEEGDSHTEGLRQSRSRNSRRDSGSPAVGG